MSTSARASAGGDTAARTWAVALHEFRRLRHGRHAYGRLILGAVPVLFAVLMLLVLMATSDQVFTEPRITMGQRVTVGAELIFLAKLFRMLVLPFVVFISAASLFANLYNSEMADRTLHHLFLLPVRREVVTVGKYVAGILVVFSTALVSWLIATAIILSLHGPAAALSAIVSLDGLAHAGSYVMMLLLATMAYGALFLLIGALVKSPALLAASVFLWEWLSLFLPTMFKRATIIHWVSSFMPVTVQTDSLFATLGDPENRLVAAIVLALFSLACVTAATWRARHVQVAYGASE